jgi:hypothetical protein
MKRLLRLQVEELSARIVPNATLPMTVHSVPRIAAAGHFATQHHLVGKGHGAFMREFANPDTGSAFQLSGVGHFTGLRNVTIEGALHSVGFVAQGRATGTVTLTNARGSVTLALTGPLQAGFAPLPGMYQFHVASATGAFNNWRANGTLTLHAASGVFHVSLA